MGISGVVVSRFMDGQLAIKVHYLYTLTFPSSVMISGLRGSSSSMPKSLVILKPPILPLGTYGKGSFFTFLLHCPKQTNYIIRDLTKCLLSLCLELWKHDCGVPLQNPCTTNFCMRIGPD